MTRAPTSPDKTPHFADLLNHLFATRVSPRGKPYTLKEVCDGTEGYFSIAYLSLLRRGGIERVWSENPRSGSRQAFIVVNDAPEHVVPLDWASAGSSGQWDRALLTQPLMWAPFVVERYILGEHAVQVPLVQDEQVVKTFLPC